MICSYSITNISNWQWLCLSLLCLETTTEKIRPLHENSIVALCNYRIHPTSTWCNDGNFQTLFCWHGNHIHTHKDNIEILVALFQSLPIVLFIFGRINSHHDMYLHSITNISNWQWLCLSLLCLETTTEKVRPLHKNSFGSREKEIPFA